MSISRSFHVSDSKLWQLFRHHLLPQGRESPFVLQAEESRELVQGQPEKEELRNL